MGTLYHIAPASAVEAAQTAGEYRPATFDAEGFVHCSYAPQVCAVADRLFRGRADLVLIEIDASKLGCPVVDENLEGGSEMYPHVYGPLSLAAVAHVHAFPCGDDGRFSMPVGYNSSPFTR